MNLRFSLARVLSLNSIFLAFTPIILAMGGSPGGPFSNGSYFPNTGTFSAIVRGENLVGTVQFSTTAQASSASGESNAAGNALVQDSNDFYHSVSDLSASYISVSGALGSTGVSVIYNEGETYRGNSNGVYDPSANDMAVMFQGSFPGQGEEKYETVVTGSDNSIIVKYFDSFFINGAAVCKVSNDFPNQTFEGEGQANINFLNFDGAAPSLQGNDQTLAESGGTSDNPTYAHRTGYNKYFKKIKINGVRVSNEASTFVTSPVIPPSFNRYVGKPLATPTATPTATATPTPSP